MGKRSRKKRLQLNKHRIERGFVDLNNLVQSKKRLKKLGLPTDHLIYALIPLKPIKK